jgi:hypothetical protein
VQSSTSSSATGVDGDLGMMREMSATYGFRYLGRDVAIG